MRKPPLQDVIVKQQAPQQAQPMRRERPPLPQFPPQRRVSATGPVENEQPFRDFERPNPPFERPERGRRFDGDMEGTSTSRKWLFIALGIGAVVILCSVALSLVFAGASVTVYPKQDTVVVNTTFTASPDTANGVITYERVVEERTAQRNVTATGESTVEERATGKITIYNKYSETPQRLIKRTRFQSSTGKIYRILNAVEVPGKKKDGTPGSIVTDVTAEEPGDAYNITGAEKFSIPGFEGAPQQGLVYAESAGDITGGFKGVKRTVADADRSAALKELEQQLRNELLSAALNDSNKPSGYYLAKEAVFYEFTALPDESVENNQVTLSLSGKIHGVLFETGTLARLLARNTVASYNGEPIRVDNMDDLSITLEPLRAADAPEGQAAWDTPQYSVQAEGKAHFIWEFDEAKLAQDLAGQKKDVVDASYEGSLLSSYTGIDRLQATIRPFWKQAFPEKPEDIVIVTKLDE